MPNSEELQIAFGVDDEQYAKSMDYAESEAKRLAPPPRNSYERVREFMESFGHPVYDEPTVIEDEAWERMRLDLILEEVGEIMDALGYDGGVLKDVPLRKSGSTDLVALADALGDTEYVVNGLALGTGIPLPKVVTEIHRSNMTKLGPDGKPIYREDGKILKGPDYEPPELEKVLFE